MNKVLSAAISAAAIVLVVGLVAALKPLIGVRAFAVTVQPALLDASRVEQAEECQAIVAQNLEDGGCSEEDGGNTVCTGDASRFDAGGCSVDAAGYDANVLGVGSAAAITSDDGYNTLLCSNVSSTAVYLGHSLVTTANGYPICSTLSTCATKTLALDTNQGQVYATMAARVDGGVVLRCVAGH